MQRVAAMKIGSTSTSLLIATDLSHVLMRQQRLVNMFADDREDALAEVITSFTDSARQTQCQVMIAAGGEAMRRHPDLAVLVRKAGWDYHEVSGWQEARLTWMAVKDAVPQMEWIVDIGGGSTEFASSSEAFSVPVGAVRQESVTWPAVGRIQHPVLIGGTAQVLSQMVRTNVIYVSQVEALLAELAAYPERLSTLDALRRQIFPQGLQLVRQLFSVYGWDYVTFHPRGFLEGLWLAAHGESEGFAW
ncbi:hypothetical protein CO251_04100 [Sulfobacillus sp. hq2]|nr:hypothetical protein CO251_04100 [Sulfobacillus sp. hq2]